MQKIYTLWAYVGGLCLSLIFLGCIRGPRKVPNILQEAEQGSASPEIFYQVQGQMRRILKNRFSLSIPRYDLPSRLSKLASNEQIDPTAMDNPLAVAEAYSYLKDYKKAIATLKEQLPFTLKGMAPYYAYHLGKYYYLNKDYSNAAQTLAGIQVDTQKYPFHKKLKFYLIDSLYQKKKWSDLYKLISHQTFDFNESQLNQRYLTIKVRTLLHSEDFENLAKIARKYKRAPSFLKKIFPDYSSYKSRLEPHLLPGKSTRSTSKIASRNLQGQFKKLDVNINARAYRTSEKVSRALQKNIRKYSKNKQRDLCKLREKKRTLYRKWRKKRKELKVIKKLLPACHSYLSIQKRADYSYRKANIHWNIDPIHRAITAFKDTFETFPTTRAAESAMYTLANLYQNRGDFLQAAKWYARFVKNYPKAEDNEDARFHHGFSLFLAGKTQQAVQALKDQKENPRAMFWLAKSYIKQKNLARAKETLREVVSEHPFNYYGVRSLMALEKFEKFRPSFARNLTLNYPMKTRPERLSLKTSVHLQTAERLLSMGFLKYASAELKQIPLKHKDLQYLAYIAVLNYISGNCLESVIAYNYLIDKEPELPSDFVVLNYPISYLSTITKYSIANKLEPEFVLSLTRQESCFNEKAKSSANAYGLMQLISSTALTTARNLKKGLKKPQNNLLLKQIDRFRSSKDVNYLYQPEFNIALGTHHLYELFSKQGSLIFSIASYNAGRGAVRRWKKQFGFEDLDVFIERIPYQETRNYTKLIIRNYYNYQHFIKGKITKNLFAKEFGDSLPKHFVNSEG